MDSEKEVIKLVEKTVASNENSQESSVSSKNSSECEVNKRRLSNQNLDEDLVDELELSDDIRDKIKGDAVGDTLYSERFILKTLMELKELNCDETLDKSIEKNLEILWDTTIEKDIVFLLLQYGVLELFAGIIDTTQENRLIEILLGILANMSCRTETRCQLCLNSDVMSIILNQLTSSDAPVLHQLMRFLHSTILFENSGDETIWFSHFKSCENFVDKFSFILENSTSNSLLMSSFEALNAICAKFAVIEFNPDSEKDSSFPQLFVKENLICSLIEAFNQVIPLNVEDENSTDLIPTHNQQKFMNLFLELNMILSQYESLSIDAYSSSINNFQKCLGRVLLPLTQKIYLLPLNSNHQGVIENINDIIQALGDTFCYQNFSQMVIIWDIIEESKNKEKSNSDWEDEEAIDSDDVCMTILEFLTRVGFKSSQDEFEKSIKNLNLDLVMKLYERINDTEDAEDEIKSVIEKIKTSIKAIWDIDVNRE